MGFLKKLFGGRDLTLREPRFAGMLYPEDKAELSDTIDALLATARGDSRSPRALVVPHAEYAFAGPVMAEAWATVAVASSASNQAVEQVVVIGTSRLVPFRGLAVTGYDGFETPLGPVVSRREAVESIAGLEQVRAIEPAFDPEESIEAQLPFLRRVLGKKVLIVPVLVGDATDEEVAEVIERVLEDETTLVVVSANLSHDVTPEQADTLDAETQRAIEAFEPETISRDHSAGRVAIRGLLRVASAAGWQVKTLGRSTSAEAAESAGSEAGAVAGPVTGYGAFAFYS